MKHIGNLIIKKGDNTDYSQLTEITGYLYIYSKAKLEANNLTSVGGGLSIYSKAKLDNLTSVGGYLYIYSNAKLEANNLTSVGGDLYIHSKAKLEANFLLNKNYKIIDNYLFIIESTKTINDIIIYKGYNVKGLKNNNIIKDNCYVAELNNFYAHGKTIKKAIEDVNFKVLSDKLKKQPIYNDTIIDINYYRIITGACKMGCKDFIEQHNITKTELRADELLVILEKTNAYGLDKFKSLLTNNNK